jgi:hypothetical protein
MGFPSVLPDGSRNPNRRATASVSSAVALRVVARPEERSGATVGRTAQTARRRAPSAAAIRRGRGRGGPTGRRSTPGRRSRARRRSAEHLRKVRTASWNSEPVRRDRGRMRTIVAEAGGDVEGDGLDRSSAFPIGLFETGSRSGRTPCGVPTLDEADAGNAGCFDGQDEAASASPWRAAGAGRRRVREDLGLSDRSLRNPHVRATCSEVDVEIGWCSPPQRPRGLYAQGGARGVHDRGVSDPPRAG